MLVQYEWKLVYEAVDDSPKSFMNEGTCSIRLEKSDTLPTEPKAGNKLEINCYREIPLATGDKVYARSEQINQSSLLTIANFSQPTGRGYM